jgi:hypothetical protein
MHFGCRCSANLGDIGAYQDPGSHSACVGLIERQALNRLRYPRHVGGLPILSDRTSRYRVVGVATGGEPLVDTAPISGGETCRAGSSPHPTVPRR